MGKNTALGDDGAVEKLVELLIVADRQLQVARGDTALLVVLRRIAGQLADLGDEVCSGQGVEREANTIVSSTVKSLRSEARPHVPFWADTHSRTAAR